MDAVKGIKIGANYFVDMAKQRNLKITSIPLKDKTAVKILSNDDTFELYHVDKGHITAAKGFKGSLEGYLNFAGRMIEKVQNAAAEGIDVMQEWRWF
ncbi:MAG: hypothetical protein E7Z87_07390 [Cyanobacteria bacterium SIG26]|nr:hypothetical protein [Cyanobacteria bacterium SIG26]